MNILHVITSLRTGGAEHLMVDLLPRLQEREHNVSLLLFDGTRTPFYEQLEKERIPIFALAMGQKAMHNPLLVFRLKDFFKQHTFDVIHTHNTPCQLLVAALAKDSKVFYITTEHNTTNKRRKWKCLRKFDKWMYDKYNSVICVSNDVKYNLEKSLAPLSLGEKVSVICNGVETEKFQKAIPCKSLLLQHKGKHLIVMVAAFRPQKDQETLIKAISLLPSSCSLLLVGDGECRHECEVLAKQLGVDLRVSFTGIRTDIPEVLAAAEVVVMSSNYEGLSLSSIEGMASGKPFIASDVDGLREIVGGAGLLFPLHDEKALARLIRDCCENKTLAEEIGNRCRERAMKYDIRQMVNGYDQIYRNLTKQQISK